MQRICSIAWISAISVLALLPGCTGNIRGTAPDEDPAAAVEAARDDLRAMARDTLRQLYDANADAQQVVEGAAGYGVFSNFGMKVLVAGGGSGRGLAVDNGTREEVFMRMAEVQAGLGFGIKKFRLVWVFQTQQGFDGFVRNGYQLGGNAALSAKAAGVGAGLAGAVSVSPGVWVYQITDDGIAAELTVKGTKYYRDDQLD